MADQIDCFRCGTSLAALTLPLSRRDMCPQCSAHVHVCRMCSNYSVQALQQCLEEDAEEVLDKQNANYCDWFKPRPDAFDPESRSRTVQAEAELASLFGESGPADATDSATTEAEDLFK